MDLSTSDCKEGRKGLEAESVLLFCGYKKASAVVTHVYCHKTSQSLSEKFISLQYWCQGYRCMQIPALQAH